MKNTLVNSEYLSLLKEYKKQGGEEQYEKAQTDLIKELRIKVTAMEKKLRSEEIIATIHELHSKD
ncbi:MAG: hypothetical protein QM737_22705 [Ferruginibacter sp.]